MNPGALFCLILAHYVADFPLQFRYIIKLRNDKNWKISLLGNSLHASIHLVVSAISIIYFFSLRMVMVVILIALLHCIIDFIKSLAILHRPFRMFSISIFLSDQIVHLICIFFVLYTINRPSPASSLFKMLKVKLLEFLNGSWSGVTYNHKLILSLVLLVIGLWGIGVFIRIVLSRMSLMPYKGALNLKLELVRYSKNDGATDGGFIIGVLERFFIIISIVLNIPIVIGFILTVKSVARLKKFDDERFVEIFIMGSFISFISAIIIGYSIRLLKVIPY